ncbi:uncharacterized protein MONBRDRAFT_22196 [Monosiga brevicollis MX1]|uniref:Uncharacterized protein n=1 Tax=Monosiga brevicollis TaxID=81824 RepID=A9UPU8_MONBE|nr:uncharacterized protein MONBRDRAFT_22196 [Monosiga brevicollis MX1]EDQ92483.1 predicted protein [Monosiga brevicollis MX1]|eukprot:XP_001742245.1 hypothetical protein [Monosiga brevicollis MX1]
MVTTASDRTNNPFFNIEPSAPVASREASAGKAFERVRASPSTSPQQHRPSLPSQARAYVNKQPHQEAPSRPPGWHQSVDFTNSTSPSANNDTDSSHAAPPTVVPLERLRVVVKSRPVNGWLDIKYDEEPYPEALYGHLSYEDFHDHIVRLNAIRRKYRCTKVDYGLLAAGVSLLPVIPFVARKKSRAKKRRQEIDLLLHDFHMANPHLRMSSDPITSHLIIEANPSVLQSK